MSITWARRGGVGYEVSSIGDKRFSALYARLDDGRTIEEWYQCDERSPSGYPLKGYDPGGTNWRLGKGKPPKHPVAPDQLFLGYLDLWDAWAANNMPLMYELYQYALMNEGCLKDTFATTPTNQAHALSILLNRIGEHKGWANKGRTESGKK
jgi:hypothetical protein